MKLKGLAWDDEPGRYMDPLREILHQTYSIDLKIAHSMADFDRRFHAEPANWDFIVTDLIDATETKESRERFAGLELMQNIRSVDDGVRKPIFLITELLHELDAERAGRVGAFRAHVFYKALTPAVNARLIVEKLQDLGLWVSGRKVFVIFGHNTDLKDAVAHLLAEHQLEAVMVDNNLQGEIMDGMVKKMHRCGAFIALFSKDDCMADGSAQPRMNVLLETGIAIGLNRGLARLIIVEEKGASEIVAGLIPKPGTPSDLGAVLTVKWKRDDDDGVKSLHRMLAGIEKRLVGLGFEIDPIYLPHFPELNRV